jgi:hypothetical protein
VDLVQQIGAYAGFAAVVGLAVLSVLYFSQARDLKRLRESVGEGGAGSGRNRASSGDARASWPEEEPAGARASRPGPASTAASGKRAAATRNGPSSVAAVPASSGVSAGERARGPIGAAAAPPGRPAGGGPRPRGPARGADPPPGKRRTERSTLPYVLLTVVGLLIVLGAGAFAIGLVGGREEPVRGGSAATTAPSTAVDGQAGPEGPSQVTFSVLNGTGVDGLARQVADQLEAAGYRRGNVTNAADPTQESRVLYAQGARAQALAVARRLDVARTEPADSGSQALGGDATVIVVVGADRAR